MNTNLITYDMDNFLNKYTRFMTKDIYISSKLYDNFLKQYNYLYDELSRNAILFRENIKYKKIINIKENKNNLLKLHNQKYLKKALQTYQTFFEKLNYEKILDTNKKAIILSHEENILAINNKNTQELITGKIKYLIENNNINEEGILILTNEIDKKLENELLDKNITKVLYNPISYYHDELLDNKKIISEKEKYSIIFNFLTIYLFPKKEKFKELYLAFRNNIYLNKDYEDFDTFKDYHNYIYKKAYLTSNLSLKKFNEKEIEKRRNYLRTLNNILMNTKEEVDIANFLYLNSIDYKYEFGAFIIENNDKTSYISFEKKEDEHDNIYLEMKDLFGNNYVEKLIYELIKRRYPLELKSDDEIYNKLKESTINNYFNDFINKYLIPLLDYYDKYHELNNLKLSDKQTKIIIEIYEYYKNYLKENNFVTQSDYQTMLENHLDKYKYIIIDGNIDVNPKTKTLKIISDYQENPLFKDNIKLTYDYKKYLIDNSTLPIKNAFHNVDELEKLTEEFEEKCLSEIENADETLKKEINIYLYEDDNRLLINKNISKLCLKIINNNKKIIIGIDKKKQIDNLVLKNYFSKHSPNKLITSNNDIIEYEEISKLKPKYNTILLPFLMCDSSTNFSVIQNEIKDIKIKIYTILNKCQKELIILCPKTKEEILKKSFKNVKNIKIHT